MLTAALQVDCLHGDNEALEQHIVLICQALDLLAPSLVDVQDIQEFPTCPHPLHTDLGRILLGQDVKVYHPITESLLALYNHQFMTLVLYNSPILDDIKYNELLDFIEELQPIMPNLSHY